MTLASEPLCERLCKMKHVVVDSLESYISLYFSDLGAVDKERCESSKLFNISQELVCMGSSRIKLPGSGYERCMGSMAYLDRRKGSRESMAESQRCR